MSLESAQSFVQKMRDDKEFREIIQDIGNREKLWNYIKNEGYVFDECDLMRAMAACMVELEATD